MYDSLDDVVVCPRSKTVVRDNVEEHQVIKRRLLQLNKMFGKDTNMVISGYVDMKILEEFVIYLYTYIE